MNHIYSLFYRIYDIFFVDVLFIKSIKYIDVFFKKFNDNLLFFETKNFFYKSNDICCAFLDIKAGSGGIDAQDCADIIFKIYLRWAEKKGFSVNVLDITKGEFLGIKDVTLKFVGDYAFGWLRTETGIHRLVRRSPFNSLNRRHTSFVSVFVYPETVDSDNIELSYKDIRIDTYRSGGAGGQHVNKTDSAVRITHILSNIVVQCQESRSQHLNKQVAIKQLKAKLYEFECLKKENEKKNINITKCDIGWGRQIRSYILDKSFVKDLRTGIETSNLQSVLDGNIDDFIKQALNNGY